MRVRFLLLMLAIVLLASAQTAAAVSPTAASSAEPQGFSPFALAITKDGRYGYLGFSLSEVIFKVRLADLSVETVADLSAYFPMESPHIALNASETKLFVSISSSRKLIVLDTQTLGVIRTIDNIGIYGMTSSQYGPLLITWDGGGTVKFINTETYSITELIDNRMFFLKIQESPSDPNLWYVVYASGPGAMWPDLAIYDHSSKTLRRTFSLPKQGTSEGVTALEVLANERKAYIATFGGWYPELLHAYGWLYSVDLVGGQVKVSPIDGGAGDLESSPDNQRLYVGTGWPIPDTNNILVVDTSSDTTVGQINLGKSKYGWAYTQVNKLRIDPANANLLYATSTDGNALVKAQLDSLTLANVRVLNREDFAPHFFVEQPMQPGGYILIHRSVNAFDLDLVSVTIRGVVTFPGIRPDAWSYDVAFNNSGNLLIAQGESVTEIDANTLQLITTHPLPPNTSLWYFVLSRDKTRIYSIKQERVTAGPSPANVFMAIDASSYQVLKNFKLDGGGFEFRPFELPDAPKLYALGGLQNGPVVIQVIETNNYTIQKTITFDQSGLLGISTGPSYPFAYDPASRTLFVGATQVILAIDTINDVIKKVIRLEDVARAIGLEPWNLTYINAVGLVYHPRQNYLYIAHLDRSFVSIYDLTNDRFLAQVIPLKGYFPAYLFANNDYSKIFSLNSRSDNVSVIDVNSKTVERVIDLQAYLSPTPNPDIKANGSDGPVTIPQGANLIITAALDPGSRVGKDADWWVTAISPFGQYWYTLGEGWVRSDVPRRAYGGPLLNLAPYTVLETSTLPAGNYTFYFRLDDNMDGVLDATYVDSVSLDIN